MGRAYIENVDGRLITRLKSPVLDDRYRLANPDGSVPEDTPESEVRIKVLGLGGYGAVIRAIDRAGLHRAVKLVDPRRFAEASLSPRHTQFVTPGYTPSQKDFDWLASNLANEIKLTNAQPFKHIVPIIDYGIFTDIDDNRFVYYAQPFIPGQRFDVFAAENRPSEAELIRNRSLSLRLHDTILSLIDDLLSGLVELSEANVTHMDIKPSNAMVLTVGDGVGSTRDRLFILDLGAAVSSQAEHADRRKLVTTPYFFPLHLLDELDFRSDDGTVAHESLVRRGAAIDMYAAGRTLEMLFLDRTRRGSPRYESNERSRAAEQTKELLVRRVVGEDFEVIEGLIDRLLDAGPEGFRTPCDARLAFQAIGRHDAQSVLSSRVLTDQSRGLRINVGGTAVQVAAPFDRIVNNPVFQRLRRLNQLAMISELFPDATHTRFAHVLQVYDLTKQFLLFLNRDAQFRLIFTQRDVNAVMAAALLHDLGQYPFSHTIEDLRKIGDVCGVPGLSRVLHDQELAERYLSRRSEGEPCIGELLDEAGIDLGAVTYMFQKTAKDPSRPPAINIGRDLVSGVIDVDRVSYLRHDSERTGLPYGKAVDVATLGDSLCIDPVGPALGIKEQGISAVEAVLAAVYWMYRNVYWTPANRGFMAAVKHVFGELTQRNPDFFEKYEVSVYGRSDWDALVFLRDEYEALRRHAGADWFDPLASVAQQRRFSYTRVFSLGFDGADSQSSMLYDDILRHPSQLFVEHVLDLVGDALPRGLMIRRGEVLIDLPLKKRLRAHHEAGTKSEDTRAETGARPVLRVKRRRRFESEPLQWLSMYEVSPLAAALGRIEDHSGRKIRVFMSNDLIGRLPELITTQVATIIRAALVEAVRRRDVELSTRKGHVDKAAATTP